MADIKTVLAKLSRSKFRASFKLTAKDIEYINRIGLSKIESHANDFVLQRLVPAEPLNDGRQTPFNGHPVFKAQHATASCCRGCLKRWHGIDRGRRLSKEEAAFVVRLIMGWIRGQLGN